MFKLSLVLSVLLIAACAASRGPVIIRDADVEPSQYPQSVEPSEQRYPAAVENTQSPTHTAKAAPVLPERNQASLPVVERLIVNANKNYQRQRFDEAITLAERGLRVDRKESRLYLVLAKAYRAQNNAQQSRNFAHQGLRYAVRGSETYQALSQLLR